MEKTLLTIVVLTYNRMEKLKKTLDAINPYLCTRVRIIVLNNASTDKTDSLDKLGLYPNIIFINRPYNVGATINYLDAFSYASDGEYIWIICDDDECDFSSMPELMNYLTNNDSDVIMVGRSVSGYSNSKTEEIKLIGRQDNLDVKMADIFNENNSIIFNFGFLPSLIYRSNSIKSEVIEKCYQNTKSFYPQCKIQYSLSDKRFSIFEKILIRKPNDYEEVKNLFMYQCSWLEMSNEVRKEYGFENVERVIFPNLSRALLRISDGLTTDCIHFKRKDSIFRLIKMFQLISLKYKFIPLISSVFLIMPNSMIRKIRDFVWLRKTKR